MDILVEIKNIYAPECFTPNKQIGKEEKMDIANILIGRIYEFLKSQYPKIHIEVVHTQGEVVDK